MKKLSLAVLASTKGTVLQAVIDAIRNGTLAADLKIVISDNKNAFALEKARANGVKAVFVDPKGKNKVGYDGELAAILKKEGIELICLVGFKRILSNGFVEKYRNRVMNVHPSLLPDFPGWGPGVHEAVLESGVKESGCTVHFVSEEVDAGPIILQEKVPVLEGDTVETLRERVQEAEKRIYPKAIQLFAEGRLRVEGNKVKTS